MDITTALILGVLQGITEFVPISSSAHLLLVGDLLSLEGANSLAFYAVLHLATTAAIIMFFWTDVLALIHTPIIIAAMLFVSSFFFMFAEWRYYIKPPQGTLTIRQGFWVGCFQALALLPGFSRSGSTLAGGMLLGMTRVEAARFSFILAIPITLAVGLKMLLELILSAGEVSWGVIAIGAFICFITALVVIRFFLDFIRKYSLWPFIWYKIGLALLVAYVTIYV